MVDTVACFSHNYSQARAKFVAAAAEQGGSLRSRLNPTLGPDGGRLFTDVARFGDADATNLLVLSCATHGVEGFCGSGAMIRWLRGEGPKRLPAGVGAVLIHAVNPNGFAWIRRVNEDNVDVNRNFVDHSKPYPKNPGYVELADALKPKQYDEASLAAARKTIEAFIQKHGPFGFQGAVSGGQHTHPDGMFYGGAFATWTNRTVRKIARRELAKAKRVGEIDFHTGLGPFGHGEIIYTADPGTPAEALTKRWYGEEVTNPAVGNSTSAVVSGDIMNGFREELPAGCEFVGIALEYGTYPVPDVLEAVRQDNWLHAHGDLDSAQGRGIKANLRERFYPSDDKWKHLVWTRAEEIIGKAIASLSA
jgi:hypothetical protein